METAKTPPGELTAQQRLALEKHQSGGAQLSSRQPEEKSAEGKREDEAENNRDNNLGDAHAPE